MPIHHRGRRGRGGSILKIHRICLRLLRGWTCLDTSGCGRPEAHMCAAHWAPGAPRPVRNAPANQSDHAARRLLSPGTMQTPDGPVLNEATLADVIAIGGDMLGEIVALFAEDAPDRIVRLHAAFAGGAADAIRREAHGLK